MSREGCVLCPRMCGAFRGEESGQGFCHMGVNPKICLLYTSFSSRWFPPSASYCRSRAYQRLWLQSSRGSARCSR